jgi:hypothetical protein
MPNQHVLTFKAAERGSFGSRNGAANSINRVVSSPVLLFPSPKSKLHSNGKQKTHDKTWVLMSCGGERGIRTPGPVTVNGFQDRRVKPLCHLSAAKIHARVVLPKNLPFLL